MGCDGSSSTAVCCGSGSDSTALILYIVIEPRVQEWVPKGSGVGVVDEEEGEGEVEVWDCVVVGSGGGVEGVGAVGYVDEGLECRTSVGSKLIYNCVFLKGERGRKGI